MRITSFLLSAFIWVAFIGSAAAQNAPKVTTNPKYARGATMAFGRMTATGTNIQERGFCYATHSNPTIDDVTTKKTMTAGSGTVYVLENLAPATIYYMRAYAKVKDGSVGYGDVIKFSTLPKGEVTYWYNNGGDDATNTRINNAATQACQIFSDLTSIKKKFDIGYSPGTPTADCGYKDQPWVNMGANSGYQRTGTLMHEMQHGLGVINYSTQWAGDILRSGSGTGEWLGDRTSAFLDFWDNTTGSRLKGDNIHLWPYGINGAHEDNGTLTLYYANAMIGQALGEDGLEHRSNTFAEPCYVFVQEDNVKYYLKNEDADRGLYSAYLIPTAAGTLKWRDMTSAEAMQNDSAAWMITFTPNNQYYQLRNAATGQYISYQSSFKTLARTTLTNNENFHLMKGRVDVGSGENAQRGYWLIHPTGDWSPKSMTANVNGAIGVQDFDLRNTATKQRWLILTAEEMQSFEQGAVSQLKADITSVLDPIKALADVPHTCSTADVDQTFADAISSIENILQTATTPTELTPLANDAWQAALNFLNAATPTDSERPFDLTFLLQNPGMDATDGWTPAPVISYSCGEFYEKTFNMKQTLKNMPAGTYCLMMQGFQRPGGYTDAYNDWAAGNNKVNAMLYVGSKTQKIAHIADCASTTKLHADDKQVGGKYYVPNTMVSASKYFAKGLYDNSVFATTTSASFSVGLRSTSMPTSYWCIFDNFRLQYFGGLTEDQIVTGIKELDVEPTDHQRVFDLQGRRIMQPAKGLYIINGKKTIIR